MDNFWNKTRKKKLNERIIKDRITGDIRTLFEQQEIDDCEPKSVSSFLNNNYIEYDTNGDKNRDFSLDEYLNKIKPYVKNIIINLQNSDTWKIELTIAIWLYFFKGCWRQVCNALK